MTTAESAIFFFSSFFASSQRGVPKNRIVSGPKTRVLQLLRCGGYTAEGYVCRRQSDRKEKRSDTNILYSGSQPNQPTVSLKSAQTKSTEQGEMVSIEFVYREENGAGTNKME